MFADRRSSDQAAKARRLLLAAIRSYARAAL